MAFEIELDARVNREGDIEEVLVREVRDVDGEVILGGTSFTLRPEGDARGYLKSGRVRAVFTNVDAPAPAPPTPVAPMSGTTAKKSDKG